MFKYIAKRLAQAIPVLLGVSILVFLIMRVFSADPAPVVLGQHATVEAMEAWREANGLNDPLIVQYFAFLAGALTGNLGESYYTHTPVTQELMSRFPATIELAVVAILIAGSWAWPWACFPPFARTRAIDGISMVFALIGVSMPIFWLGILLIILFSGVLHILPSGGRIDPLLAPVGARDCTCWTPCSRATSRRSPTRLPYRAAGARPVYVLDGRDHPHDALEHARDAGGGLRANGPCEGLRCGRVNRHHALRCAMLPVTTVIGLQLGSLLGGAMLTETVFAWPGMGKYVVECILKSDFPVVQGAVLLIGAIFIVINLVVDVVYAYLDPRIKYAQEEG